MIKPGNPLRQWCLLGTIAALGLCPAFLLAGEVKLRQDLSEADRLRVEKVTQPATTFDRPEGSEALSGGEATSKGNPGPGAFYNPSGNIGFEERERFQLGQALFEKFWVSSPSSTQASDGLGPLFNARSCQSCHIRGGRGEPLGVRPEAVGMLLRLAQPPATKTERDEINSGERLNMPDPVYGHQFQDRAVPGLAAEGRVIVRFEKSMAALADGTVVTLQRPVYGVADLAYGPMGNATTLSPRMANPLIGMGLIEAIDAADIEMRADPSDLNGDGISGRAQQVRDPETGKLTLGRFGWKAQSASVREQSADALSNDIGISTPIRPDSAGDCTSAEAPCRDMPNGVQPRLGSVEAPDPVLPLLTAFTENLAVPMRRNVDEADVLAGKRAFYEVGCALCHAPKFVTSRRAASAEHRFQLIWPYSDFLLHDMGSELGDGQEVGRASGQEWRTPPLWGIGLTETVNGHSFFLHDGRARSFTEAILWHGGEAKKARDGFAGLDAGRRAALIAFLESL